MALRVVSFKVEEELVELLERVARERGLTKSEVIRRALRQYLVKSDLKPFVTRRMKIYG